MLSATCHCGAVRVEVPRRPRTLTDCNCSIYRRYGALWAYYKAETVRVSAERGSTEEYVWGDESLKFIRCARCGCVTHWEPVVRTPASRMGVNARNFEPGATGTARIRHLNGAFSWKYLD